MLETAKKIVELVTGLTALAAIAWGIVKGIPIWKQRRRLERSADLHLSITGEKPHRIGITNKGGAKAEEIKLYLDSVDWQEHQSCYPGQPVIADLMAGEEAARVFFFTAIMDRPDTIRVEWKTGKGLISRKTYDVLPDHSLELRTLP